MAKSTALSTTHHAAPHHYRAPAPIVVRASEVAALKKKKGKGGHHRVSSEKALMGLVIGGFALGFIDKPGGMGASIPTIPILGKAGTIAVVAHFVGKGKAGMITDVRNAAAVVAGYEFGLKGSVSGDE